MSRLLDQLAARYFAQTVVTKGKSAVGRRLRPHLGTVRCRTVDGVLLDADPKDLIQYSVMVTGEWEPEESQVLRERLRPGSVAYDVGANVGYFTLLASRLVGPTGRVIAFEPNESTLVKLRHHLRLNGADNVTVVPVGLADHDGHAEFHSVAGANSGASALRPLDDSVVTRIELARLDRLVDEMDLPSPDFIKMDVEGAELLALRGMERTLRAATGVELLVEVTDKFLRQTHGSEEELLEFLTAVGLRFGREVSRHRRVDEQGRPFQYTALFDRAAEGTEQDSSAGGSTE